MQDIVPNLSHDEIRILFPNYEPIGKIIRGGQKLFCPVRIDGREQALKIVSLTPKWLLKENPELSKEELKSYFYSRVKREIDCLKEASHPHIIKLADIELKTIIYKEEELAYFTEEYIKGGRLSDLISSDDELPSLDKLIKFSSQMANAVSRLDELNKVHRDIKPDNIMFNQDSQKFILLDMGVVFDFDASSITVGPASFVPGTMRYCSPEHTDFEGRRSNMGFRSDLFSLGICMYEYWTGIHPFIAKGEFVGNNEVVSRIVSREMTDPKIYRTDTPTSLLHLFKRVLNKKLHLRHRNIHLFLDDLENIRRYP